MQLLRFTPLQSSPYLRSQIPDYPDRLCPTHRVIASQACDSGSSFSAISCAWRGQLAGLHPFIKPNRRAAIIRQVSGRSSFSTALGSSLPSRSSSCSGGDAVEDSKARLASVISRLNATLVPSQDDLQLLLQVVEELSALNPAMTEASEQAPLIDGRWDICNLHE